MCGKKLDPQERRVMIVPVGLERARITEGCLDYAVNVIYLINNPIRKINNDKESFAIYYYTKRFAEQVKKDLEGSFRIIEERIAHLNSINSCLKTLIEIYKKELLYGRLNKIFINVSTASKAFALAAYIFSLLHPEYVKIFYSRTSKYTLLEHLQTTKDINQLEGDFIKNGLTSGPYEIEEAPILPILHFTNIEKELIKILSKETEFNSIMDLLKKTSLRNTRSNFVKISRALVKLESYSLIQKQKDGKNIIIKSKSIINVISDIINPD